MCLLVCLSAFYRPHDSSYLAALPPSPRAGAVRRPRASGQACTARARARMPYNIHLNEKIVALIADAFQKQNRTRAHAVVYVPAEIFKKREKENQHATSQVQFTVCLLLDHGVFTFRIVLNRILHKSSLLAPMESRRTRRPTFTAEERLERRREQDRRRHAETRARERREQTQVRRDVDRLPSSQARA